jgi:hypothetical protein
MDKVISARLDESAIVEMERVTRQLGMTKKRFLEEAIHGHVQRLAASSAKDVWSETSGSWKRREAVAATVKKAREAFSAAYKRHQG